MNTDIKTNLTTAEEKINPQLTNVIAETLLIPLFLKSQDAKGVKPILNDRQSIKLVEKIDYPFSKFAKQNTMSLIGTMVRAKYLDQKTSEFINGNSNPIIIAIGCGLDDRRSRLNDATKAKAQFYQIDLPQVIDLRRKLLPETEQDIFLEYDIFADEWLEFLLQKHPQGNFLIIAEGVFIYFTEAQVKLVMTKIASKLPHAQIYFDTITVLLSKNSDKHDTVSKVAAKFNWGIDKDQDIEKWHPNLKLTSTFYIMHAMRPYNFLVRLLSFIPVMGKGSKILGFKID